MAEFSKLVITGKGQVLLAKVLAGQGDIEFTKISASDRFYEVEKLETLISIPDVKQTNKISKVTRTNEAAVKVETAFSNTGLTEGYYMRTLGLYAVDPDEGEILYAATTETTGNCYMPAYNGVTVSGAYVQLVTTIGNAENVSVKIDQAAIATIGNIKDLQTQIDEMSQVLDDQITKILGNNPDGEDGPIFAEGIRADNVVDAINEVFQSGSEKKDRLVENLTAMGMQTSADDTWDVLLDRILDMTDTSRDTVTAPVLLTGYTAHDAAGEQIEGDMPEMAAITVDATNVSQDSDYTYFDLPAGHYDEDSKVRTANSNIKSEISVLINAGGNNAYTRTVVLNKDYDTVYVFASSGDSNNGAYLNVTANGITLTPYGSQDNQNYYHARNYVAKDCKKGSSITIKGNWNTLFTVIAI